MTFMSLIYLNPGDKVWYIIADKYVNDSKYYRGDMVVECLILETQDIYSHPDPDFNVSLWYNRFIDSKANHVSVPQKEVDELGWNKWKQEPPSFVEGLNPVNQFLWIDEPVGHAVTLGDECFLSLSEAMTHARAGSRKHLKRRLVRSRGETQTFIAKTWRMSGDNHPGFIKKPLKKVYVKRKR